MTAEQILALLLQVNRLKAMPRTGWFPRGIVHPESVAAHSYGVAFLALVLSQAVEEPLDRASLLTIALLHDLPESYITDIPYSALRFIAPEAKRAGELGALAEMLDAFPFGVQYRELWLDFEDYRTPEGRLVRDADRLELMIQTYVYEQSSGNRRLQEFWDTAAGFVFEYPISRQLFAILKQQRDKEIAH